MADSMSIEEYLEGLAPYLRRFDYAMRGDMLLAVEEALFGDSARKSLTEEEIDKFWPLFVDTFRPYVEYRPNPNYVPPPWVHHEEGKGWVPDADAEQKAFAEAASIVPEGEQR